MGESSENVTEGKFASQQELKLKEFLDGELKYVKNLEKIVAVLEDMNESMKIQHPVQMPTELRDGRDKIVVGNLLHMRDFHKDQLTVAIREHLRNPALLRDLFKKEAEGMKQMYGEYATKLKMNSCIIKDHEAYFRQLSKRAGLKTSLASELNGPMVHLLQYHLFFVDLAKLAKKAGWTDGEGVYTETGGIVRDIGQITNNLMLAGKVTDLPDEGDMNQQGVLIHVGNLTLKKPTEGFSLRSVVTRVMGESRLKVFLFKRSLIVCSSKRKLVPHLDNLQVSSVQQAFTLEEQLKFVTRLSILNIQVERGEGLDFYISETWSLDNSADLQRLVLVADSREEKEEWVKVLEKEIISNLFIGDPRLAEDRASGVVSRAEDLYDHGEKPNQISRGLSKWYK